MLTPQQINELGTREFRRYEDAAADLMGFTRYTYPKYHPNWHHMVLCSYLDSFLAGKFSRGMVFMPPRHGKSELVSKRLPAFALGRNRDEQIIVTSYSGDLASKFNRECQTVIDDPRYQRIFPATKLPGMAGAMPSKKVRTSEMFEVIGDAKGFYRSAGVGGGITGMGFTLGIIDDPFKDHQDAFSQLSRERVWDWYNSTFITRMEKNARILVVMTRWHEDDLAGRLLALAKDDPKADQWEVIKLPAIREMGTDKYDIRIPGEALWPDKKNIADLDKIRRQSPRDWNSIWQQDPQTDGGNMVKQEWWRFYDVLPLKFDEMILSVDATFKGGDQNDYVVLQVWGRVAANKYLIDQVRKKMGIIDTMNEIRKIVVKYPRIRHKLIEDTANGPAVIEMLKSRISGIIPIRPEGSKESRVNAESDQIESGNVYLPLRRNAGWIVDFIDEWNKFPRGKHDDQVDCGTQALARLRRGERRGTRTLADLT